MEHNVSEPCNEDKLPVILNNIKEKLGLIQYCGCDIVLDEEKTDIQDIITLIDNKIKKEFNLAK